MSDILLKMPLNYEPLRKNRWLFRFPADLGIQEWWLSSASRPTITQNETKIPFLNVQSLYPQVSLTSNIQWLWLD